MSTTIPAFVNMPNFIRMKDSVLDTQVIAGLWRIYDAIQLYKLRTGEYPAYLWGGSRESWEVAVKDGRYKEIPDPLIKAGILTEPPTMHS
ncbi:MAG: hypothetical protein ACREJQ_04590 [bacterium]